MGALTLVFMGTPELAATVLRQVLAWPGGRVVAAYCQPDKPAGRGMSLKAPPVKLLAHEHGIPVHQPENFKNEAETAILREIAPDYLLVAAYGLILPQRVLDVPSRMALNVHTSLLPAYRGAAPIQRAVMNGDRETGVTIMGMERGMDTGPIILQDRVAIADTDTAGTLHDRLAERGGALLLQALEGLEAGRLTPVPQDHTQATHAAKLVKADGMLDFSRPVRAIHAQARGVTPWPGAFAFLERDGEAPLQVGITPGRIMEGQWDPQGQDMHPGALLGLVQGGLGIACADGVYIISHLRPAGKSGMDAASFINGYCKGRSGLRFRPLE